MSFCDSSRAVPIEGASLFVATDGNVVATFQGKSPSTIYSNDLLLESPAGAFSGVIFNNFASSVGDTVDLGFFPAGTELVFQLHVNTTGDDFFSGPASRNPDNKTHVRVDDAWMPGETLVE